MANNNFVHDFIMAKHELFRHFKCTDEYFVQIKLGHNWEVIEEDGVYFLNYWENADRKTSAVAVTKGDVVQVFQAEDYTMVVAIDCVRIAFIFNNILNSGSLFR